MASASMLPPCWKRAIAMSASISCASAHSALKRRSTCTPVPVAARPSNCTCHASSAAPPKPLSESTKKMETPDKLITVMLVDDHALFRSGIRSLLQRHTDFSVVGEAADGVEGIKRAIQLQPDVVLLDLNMAGMSGVEALQLMQHDCPDTAIVMLTVSEDAEDLDSPARGRLRLSDQEYRRRLPGARHPPRGRRRSRHRRSHDGQTGGAAPGGHAARGTRVGTRQAHAARKGNHRLPVARREQQGNRAYPRPGRKHSQDPRAERAEKTQPHQPRAGGRVCGRAPPGQITRVGV